MRTAASLPGTAAPSLSVTRWRLPRTLLGLVVAAAAGLGVYLYGASQERGEPVLVVAREVAAGQPLTAADLRLVTGQLPELTRRIAVPAQQEQAVIGQVASRRLVPGTPLLQEDVAGLPALRGGQVAVSVPLRPDTAPPLAPHARVDVIGLVRPGEAATAGPLVRAATVQRVVYGSGPTTTVSSGDAPVVVAGAPRALPTTVILLVNRDDATRVAQAIASGGVTLALLPDDTADTADAATSP